MPLRISCPGCQATYNVGDDLIGKRIKCKRCQQAFPVQARTKAAEPEVIEVAETEAPPAPKRVPARPSQKEGITSARPSKPTAAHGRPGTAKMQSAQKQKPEPARKKGDKKAQKSALPLLLILGGGGAFLLLLLVCGGIGGYFFYFRTSSPRPVSAPQAIAQAPIPSVQPEAAKPADPGPASNPLAPSVSPPGGTPPNSTQPNPPPGTNPAGQVTIPQPTPPTSTVPMAPVINPGAQVVIPQPAPPPVVIPQPAPPPGTNPAAPAVVIPQPAPGPGAPPIVAGPGGATIPVQVLQQIKEATVFVKVEAGRDSASGSGFVMHTLGETAYIVTNHHVVVPEEERVRPGRAARPVGPVRITLVFNSGTQRERSVPCEIVATDKERDLAVLKVTGQKELPRAIDITHKQQYVELMPIFIFGFPFGDMLAVGNGNPAVTINRGSVSSIRLDDKGDMRYVQIDGALNPGNSGGPVVDNQGRLVGVSVAAIRGSGIGMAIPPEELTKMLWGRVSTASIIWPTNYTDKAEIRTEVRLIDPLNQVKEVALHYLPAGSVPPGFSRNKDGWPAMPGGQKVPLKLDGQKASGTFTLPVTQPGQPVMTYQVMYINGQGKTIYTSPGTVRAPQAKDVAVQPADPSKPGAIAAAAPHGWKEVGCGFKKEAYFVWLPPDGKIEDNERSSVSRYGQIRLFVTVCARRDGSVFAASQLTLPPQLGRESPKVRQDLLRDIFLDEVGGKLIEEKPAKQDGLNGKDYLAETRTGMARLRVLGTGVGMFQILFVGTKQQVESKEVTFYFDSFRRKAPQAVAGQPQPGGPVQPGGPPPTGGHQPSITPTQPGALPPPPKISAANESVKGDLMAVDNLKVTPVKVRANVLDCMFWADANGSAFWAIDGGGKVFRISFPDLIVTQKIELNRKCSWLAPSAEGLIVSVEETEELWVLDLATFAVKKAIKVPKIKRAASAPNLSLAFVHNGSDVLQVDLKTGATSMVAGHSWNPTVSPDGKYLFVRSGTESMDRFVIRDGKAIHEQSSPRIAAGPSGPGPLVSPDSKFVALPAYPGNGEKGAIHMYPVENIERPEADLLPGRPGVMVVNADPASGKFYAMGLLVFDKEGKLEKEYKLDVGNTKQMLVHPKGGKMLVMGTNKFLLVELPQK